MLKELRQKAKLTQSELALELGYVSSQFILNIERGLSMLPPGKFKRTAKVLGVDIETFINHKLRHDKARLMKRYGGLK